ncbi:unnamed protein product [Symbiodinium necroappetens]|uniref:Nas2 N-terminal domain-containing protein n=1 Tax=Symbiodinium necroappetens TaxID=1628268 RepID=A0A812R0V6_9DINO|nr:unnamed protein product [Symbiodinium necroappetens]
MDPAALEEFRKLDQEKNRLEAEIKTLYDYLTEDGMPGVSGPLVDEEGFPRGDIDLYAVRQARNKYVCAQTDHTEVMKKIEQVPFVCQLMLAELTTKQLAGFSSTATLACLHLCTL